MTFGWKTLDTGEKALVFSLGGRARLENGPKRLFLNREKFTLLAAYHASQTEYLIIHNHNGEIEHKPGPLAMHLNPMDHVKIAVEKAISLDASEVLVVYSLHKKTKEVQRYLKYGPSLYIPAANEWLHKFSWHGTDPQNKTRKIPGALTFTKLKVIPDQFYYNVDEVRTADDALMRVKLMIFYEFKNIEQMINSTSDPIADFINCVTADLMLFASKLVYMEFIERSGDLNNLEMYPQLMERCKLIGAEVSKVVFRGYYASPKLQQMHDHAVQARTKLKMEYEREEQKQELTDLNMRNDQARVDVENKMEKETLQHKQEIERSENHHKLQMYTQDQLEKTSREKKEAEARYSTKATDNEQKLEHFGELNRLGVNMTDYILSLRPQPQKVVKLIVDDKSAVVHYHQN